jgi:hypothetical protein
MQPYKATIRAAFYPIATMSRTRLARGRQAISEYTKAANDPLGTLELMVYYVECGTQLAGDVGDIAPWFYSTLTTMFDQVLQTLQPSDHETIDRFLPRLASIVNRAEDIGWGYYDNLSDALEEAFPVRSSPR